MGEQRTLLATSAMQGVFHVSPLVLPGRNRRYKQGEVRPNRGYLPTERFTDIYTFVCVCVVVKPSMSYSLGSLRQRNAGGVACGPFG